ncbi:MAG: tetratricopeptide repeat protein, partial [Pirellulaceae bacterium]
VMPTVRRMRVYALAELGRWDRAYADSRLTIWTSTGSVYEAAILSLKTGHLDEFHQICQRFMAKADDEQLDGNNVAWLFALAPAADDPSYQKDLAKAVALSRKDNEASPDTANLLNTLGGLLVRSGQLEEAARHLSRSIELQNDDPTAHDLLFLAMLQTGQASLEEARQSIERARKKILAHREESWLIRLELELLLDDAQRMLNAASSNDNPTTPDDQ